MQGIILNTHTARSEDLIVKVLTNQELLRCYRFYGVRHSHLIIGNLIDFELEIRALFLPKLHSTMQLALPWQRDAQIFSHWQEFCQLLCAHLDENPSCGSFYYALMQELITRLSTQAPKRALLDAYARLLAHEGRLQSELICSECAKALEPSCVVSEGFLLKCSSCGKGARINSFKMQDYLNYQNSSIFEDSEISELYRIIQAKL